MCGKWRETCQKLDVCCVQALRSCWGAVEQMRSYYVDWRMLRDVKRRQMAFDYADERLRINALRKNTILPKELQVGSSFLFTTSSSLCHTISLTVCSYYLKSHDFTKVLVAHTIYVKQLKVHQQRTIPKPCLIVFIGDSRQRNCSTPERQLPCEDTQQVCDDFPAPRSEAEVATESNCIPTPS